VSRLIQPHDVVEATRWLKLRSEARKGAEGKTVNLGLDHAVRAENRGNLGRAISWTHMFFQKSGCVGFWILGVHI